MGKPCFKKKPTDIKEPCRGKLFVAVVDKDDKPIRGTVMVKVTNQSGEICTEEAKFQGTHDRSKPTVAYFGEVPVGAYTISPANGSWIADKAVSVDVAADNRYGRSNPNTTLKIRAVLKAYLKLLFKDPEKNERVFPEGFAVRLTPDSGAPVDATVNKDGVLSKDGKSWVEVPRSAKGFTLDFKQAAVNYIVCEKRGEATKSQELAAEGALGPKVTAGQRVLGLPTDTWTLKNSDWKVDDVPAYKKDEFKFTKLEDMKTTVGTEKAPVKLVLDPKWHFCRFEYFDRCFGRSDHGDKPISIPPVMLKGVCKTRGGSSDKYEAKSNWTIGGDHKALVQCLPWIIAREEDGKKDLSDLNKDTILEFGEENTFVVSESAVKREIKKLDPAGADKDKLKPGLDRPKYYDLPKLWKSTNYYTRLYGTDGKYTTGKFFDELEDDEIKVALDSAKPLAFSLDDIVLVKLNSQEIKDQDEDGDPEDLSKHSRLALLYLDPADKFKVKVHDPRAKYPYHSKSEFVEDETHKHRNVIIDGDPKTRAVVFCSGFYDVYDKRTDNADFAKKQILGARAAKRDDDTISIHKRFSANDDVTKAYVHRKRNVDLYYLHCGGVDDKTVYGALVTYWSARFFYRDADAPPGWDVAKKPVNGTIDDKRNYIEKGMANSMERWNVKDYQLEQTDDKKDVIIKTFSLFEAKEFEDPADTFIQRGGKHKCMIGVRGDNDKGSSMSLKTGYLRQTAYKGEGEGWGSNPGTPAELAKRVNDYDGNKAPARLALAHELGHSAGLYDEYVYYVPGKSGLPRYDQYYHGMPYVIEKSSLMKSNMAIRIHHYWGRANWVNDEARATKSLYPFLGAKKFMITYAPAGKTKLKYKLIDPADADYFDPGRSKLRNIYKPAYSTPHPGADVVDNSEGAWSSWAPYRFGYNGTCDLFLYYLGDDEYARSLKGGPYDGILVVQTRISVKFLKSFPTIVGGGGYTDADRALNTKTGANDCADATVTSVHTEKIQEWKWDSPPRKLRIACEHRKTSNHGNQVIQYKKNRGAWTDLGASPANQKWSWHTKELTGVRSLRIRAKLTHSAGGDCSGYVRQVYLGGSAVDEKDWLGELDKTIMDMLDGKFKFTHTHADKLFAKTYMRFFIQYEVVKEGEDASKGSHFTLAVKFDTSNRFVPTGQNLSLGSKCENNTVIRYIYGRLSERKLVRATQDTRTNLVQGHMSKFKEWLDDKVGVTFTIGDIT